MNISIHESLLATWCEKEQRDESVEQVADLLSRGGLIKFRDGRFSSEYSRENITEKLWDKNPKQMDIAMAMLATSDVNNGYIKQRFNECAKEVADLVVDELIAYAEDEHLDDVFVWEAA
jgi:ketopantoate reductase